MRGAPHMAQPGFAPMHFPAELGAPPPLPLHPPGTSTPNSPMDPSSKALSVHFISSPVTLTVSSRVEALCGGSVPPARAWGDPPLPASTREMSPWPPALARTSPSPPSPRAAPPWGNSRLTLPQRLVPLGSCHCTASSSPEPAHCSGGLLLEIDLINAWAMRFLGFPLIPSMQIGRTHSSLHWLAGCPWAARGAGAREGGTLQGGVSPGTGKGVLGQAATSQRGLQGLGLCGTGPCIAWLHWDVFFCREGCFAL